MGTSRYGGTDVDEAQVIQLHADPPAGLLRRTRQLGTRPVPGPGQPAASIHTLSTAPAAEPAEPGEPGEPAVESPADPSAAAVAHLPWEHRFAGALSFLRRRLEGDYRVDEFGFDRDLTENAVLPVFKPLYQNWFRVEVNGVENIPAEGGALLVANHAGGLWALDAAMTAVAVHVEHPAGRFLRMLGADLIFGTPGLGALARKTGSTLACADDAERLLRSGELVGVWPEGFKGIGKPFRERYKLQRFGRGGFVHAAIKAGVPIIPVSIVGSEEIHPVIGNSKLLARMLALPYFPITPTFPWLGPLGLVPLPSKWYIEFGAPIHTEDVDPEAAEDAAAVFDLADRVRETIQSSLYR
ncbi:MAG: hypothetical protein QOC66_1515, partial [Pseudonocardiales bacterium]|nr:hypothetical protein [Pseudonocardiales bacterium]